MTGLEVLSGHPARRVDFALRRRGVETLPDYERMMAYLRLCQTYFFFLPFLTSNKQKYIIQKRMMTANSNESFYPLKEDSEAHVPDADAQRTLLLPVP